MRMRVVSVGLEPGKHIHIVHDFDGRERGSVDRYLYWFDPER